MAKWLVKIMEPQPPHGDISPPCCSTERIEEGEVVSVTPVDIRSFGPRELALLGYPFASDYDLFRTTWVDKHGENWWAWLVQCKEDE